MWHKKEAVIYAFKKISLIDLICFILANGLLATLVVKSKS